MRRAIGLAALAALAAAPAAADVSSDIEVSFTEQPRLVSKIPLRVERNPPGAFRLTVVVSVAGAALTTVSLDGETNVEGLAFPVARLTAAQRGAIAAAAKAKKVRPLVAATADATGASAAAGSATRMRLAPFYDASLRFPDAPSERSWSVGVDLPGEWTQVFDALENTYVPGTFSRYVGTRDALCHVRVDVLAQTAQRAPRPRGPLEAVATRRAPRSLPGTRPLLVVRAGASAAPCGEAVARAAVRRAVRTAVVRHALPTAGPGFDAA
jgi:hypothetical protein